MNQNKRTLDEIRLKGSFENAQVEFYGINRLGENMYSAENPNHLSNCRSRIADYEKGFDASTAYHQDELVKRDKQLEVAKKALEFECGNRCAIGINLCNAREALEEMEKVT